MMDRDEILHELREMADMWLAETEEFSIEDGFEAGKRTCALEVRALVAGAERPASEDEEEAGLDPADAERARSVRPVTVYVTDGLGVVHECSAQADETAPGKYKVRLP